MCMDRGGSQLIEGRSMAPACEALTPELSARHAGRSARASIGLHAAGCHDDQAAALEFPLGYLFRHEIEVAGFALSPRWWPVSVGGSGRLFDNVQLSVTRES